MNKEKLTAEETKRLNKIEKLLAKHRKEIGHEIGHFCQQCQRIVNDNMK